MRESVKSAAGALADLVFPRACVSCGGAVEDSPLRHLCALCARTIVPIEDPCCATCGSPFFGDVVGERICPHCQGLGPAFRSGRAAVVCRGAARDLVHELKYHRGIYLEPDIESVFRRCPVILERARAAVLVPVPLHPRKQRERGYNQSEVIARALAKAAGGTCRVEMLLDRVVDTPSQTAFDRETRLRNLKNAFSLARKAVITADHSYVLVDDVFTTGSTLNSCARVLRRAGALNLDVITFGHG